MRTKKLLALLLALSMFVALMAGCNTNNNGGGGSETEDPKTEEPKTDDPKTEEPKTEEPKTEEPKTEDGDTKILRYGLSSYDGYHMPILYSNVYDSQFCNLNFESLVDNDHEGNYVPELATWEMENDNHTYVFTLYDGIHFADLTPLTTADVEFTYHMIAHKDYDGPRTYAVSDLVGYDEFHSGETTEFPGIEVRDEKTIAFTFKEGFAGPANIKHFVYGIMNKEYYEADTWEKFIEKLSTPDEHGGSGPYMIMEYKPKELVRLVKNENYWNIAVNNAYYDEVLGIEVPSESVVAAVQTGQIDFGEPGANKDYAAAADAAPGVTRYNDLANGYTYMIFNCRNGIFDDVKVRQAFMYSLDRASFIDIEYGDLARVGTAPLSPVSWAFPDESDLNPYAYDPEKAAELLDEAGWLMGDDNYRYKDGRKLSVVWWVYSDATWPGTLSGMASDSWKSLGIELKIELYDFATTSVNYKDNTKDPREFDIYTQGFSLSADPDPTGGPFDADTYAVGGYDGSGFYNDRAQELIKQGRVEFDQEKRAEIYKEWGKLLNEMIPSTVVAYRNFMWAISDDLEGMSFTAMTNWTYNIFDLKPAS